MRLSKKFFISITAILLPVLFLFGLGLSSYFRGVLEERIHHELSNTRDMLQDQLEIGVNSSIKTHLRTIAEIQYRMAEYLHNQYEMGRLSEEEAYRQMRNLMLDADYAKVGTTGYLAGVSSSGLLTIHPKSEGADITGASFWPQVKVILNSPRQEGYFLYDWKNTGEEVAREKAAYIKYFEPWDLILWASSYKEEFDEIVNIRDFKKTIGKLRIDETGYAFVVDKDANLLIHPFSEGENMNSVDYIREMITRGEGMITYKQSTGGDHQGQEKLVYFGTVEETGWIVGVGTFFSEAFAILGAIRLVLTLVFSIAILLILGITFILTRQITRPLEKLKTVLHDLLEGEGNLTLELGVQSRDEIGDISQSFDQFLQHLREIMINLQKVSHGSSKIGSRLSTLAEQNSDTLESLNHQVSEMKGDFHQRKDDLDGTTKAVDSVNQQLSGLSTEIDDQAAAINESSATIEEISASIDNVQRIAEDRTSGMKTVVEAIEDGGSKVEETDNIIREISSNADQMAEAISIINDIADNTNLLAMNAAIEAAHAGDAGKGFAVVADEIRKLSETTSENARNISSALEHVIERVGQAKRVSALSGEAFSSLDKEVRQVTSAFQEITLSMGELSTSSGEILKAIQQINETTDDIRNKASIMVDGTNDVTQSVFRVNDSFSHMNETLVDISAGLEQIQQAVHQLAQLSVKNEGNLGTMNTELDKFTT